MKPAHLLIVMLTALQLACVVPPDESTSKIQEGSILNLYDAFGRDSSLIKDFGFSCIVKYAGKIILFDAGSNAEIFKFNTDKLGINLREIDIVVVSHGHFDHLNGLDYLLQVNPNVKIYFPYDIFWGAPVPFDATGSEPNVQDSLPIHMQYFDGSKTVFSIDQSGRFWNADVEFIKESTEIFPGLDLISTSSNYMGYFSCYPGKSFVEDQFQDGANACKNTNLPELSLSMQTDSGRILVVGCSHTGVENIVEQSLLYTNDNIELVYGGFHMLPFDRNQITALANLLKNDYLVRRVAPAHCTGHLAFKILKDRYADDYLYAGLGEVIQF